MKTFILIILNSWAIFTPAQTNTAMPNTGNTAYTGGLPDSSIQAPNSIVTKFNSSFPNMHPVWSIAGKNYRADYTEGTLHRTVIFDRDGNQLSREEQLITGYPDGIGEYYIKNYPTETYSVWLVVDGDGNKNYYTNRTTERLLFDKNGKYKSRVKNTTLAKTD